jgi:hypothetical protein
MMDGDELHWCFGVMARIWILVWHVGEGVVWH